MERIQRAILLVLYQMTLLAGIMLLPVALITQRFGFALPLHRMIEPVKESYEQVA